jgi:hypothetical protein
MNYLNYKELEYLCLSFQPVEKAKLLFKYLNNNINNNVDILLLTSILINDSYNCLTDNDKELLHIKYKENLEKIFCNNEIHTYLPQLIYFLKTIEKTDVTIDIIKDVKVEEKNIEIIITKQKNIDKPVVISTTNIYKEFIDNILIVDSTITKNRIYKDDMLNAFNKYSGMDIDNKMLVKFLSKEKLHYDASNERMNGKRGVWKYVSFKPIELGIDIYDEEETVVSEESDYDETLGSYTEDKTTVESDSYGNIIKQEENKEEYMRDYNIEKFKKDLINNLPDIDLIDESFINKNRSVSLFK